MPPPISFTDNNKGLTVFDPFKSGIFGDASNYPRWIGFMKDPFKLPYERQTIKILVRFEID